MRNPATAKIRAFPLWCSFVTFVVCFLILGCAGEPKHPTWNNATGAEQHERLMWKAIQEKNWPDFESHLSSTFVGVNADGQLLDRAGWLQQWKSAPLQEFTFGDLQVHPEGPDMKVTYIFQMQGAGTSPAQLSGLRVISTWQQLKKGWILSSTSMTPIQNH